MICDVEYDSVRCEILAQGGYEIELGNKTSLCAIAALRLCVGNLSQFAKTSRPRLQ
jgi:hypothetical protein